MAEVENHILVEDENRPQRSGMFQGAGGIEPEIKSRKKAIEESLFGVLYTLTQEKLARKKYFATFLIIVDYLQLAAFAVTPAFQWRIEGVSPEFLSQVTEYVGFAQLQTGLQSLGYEAFLAGFSIVSGLLIFSVIVSIFVAYFFKNNHFPFVWPIKVARVFSSLFLSSFYISSLQVFLVSVDCFTIGRAEAILESFPTIKCFEMPNLLMIFLSALMIFIFFGAALVITIVQFDPSPSTPELLGCPDPKFEFRNFLVKTIITVLSVVLSTYGVVQALALLFSSLIFTYNVLYHFPFYTKGVNYCRVGLFASLVWLGLCATVLTLVAGENAGLQHNVTIVTLAGLVPSGFIGALFAYLRGKNLGNYDTCLGWLLRASDAKIVDENSISSITGKNDFKKRTKLMKAGSGQSFIAIRAVGVVNGLKFPEVTRRELMEANPGDLVVHRTFRSPADVERSTRFVKKNPSDPSRVFLGNLIYQEGLRQFPNNAFLHLAYCNYLLSYSKQREEAYSHLDKARQLQPRFTDRFIVFVHDRHRVHEMQANDSGTSAMDLVAYVDFRNRYGAAISNHLSILKTQKQFWSSLQKSQMNARMLSRYLFKMGDYEAKAKESYASLLERYSKSVKVLRSYGRFLEEVMGDPLGARKYYVEADRIEDEDSTTKTHSFIERILESSGHDDVVALRSFSQLREDRDSVAVLSLEGRLEFVNNQFATVFGFHRSELSTATISSILYCPYPDRSPAMQIMKHLLKVGSEKYYGKLRILYGRHKNGYLFPVHIIFNKYQTGGASRIFMTAQSVKNRTELPTVLVIDRNCKVIDMDNGLSETIGFSASEVKGKRVEQFMDEVSTLLLEDHINKYHGSLSINSNEKERPEDEQGRSMVNSQLLNDCVEEQVKSPLYLSMIDCNGTVSLFEGTVSEAALWEGKRSGHVLVELRPSKRNPSLILLDNNGGIIMKDIQKQAEKGGVLFEEPNVVSRNSLLTMEHIFRMLPRPYDVMMDLHLRSFQQASALRQLQLCPMTISYTLPFKFEGTTSGSERFLCHQASYITSKGNIRHRLVLVHVANFLSTPNEVVVMTNAEGRVSNVQADKDILSHMLSINPNDFMNLHIAHYGPAEIRGQASLNDFSDEGESSYEDSIAVEAGGRTVISNMNSSSDNPNNEINTKDAHDILAVKDIDELKNDDGFVLDLEPRRSLEPQREKDNNGKFASLSGRQGAKSSNQWKKAEDIKSIQDVCLTLRNGETTNAVIRFDKKDYRIAGQSLTASIILRDGMDVVIELSADYRVRTWPSVLETLTGIDALQAVGRPFKEVWSIGYCSWSEISSNREASSEKVDDHRRKDTVLVALERLSKKKEQLSVDFGDESSCLFSKARGMIAPKGNLRFPARVLCVWSPPSELTQAYYSHECGHSVEDRVFVCIVGRSLPFCSRTPGSENSVMVLDNLQWILNSQYVKQQLADEARKSSSNQSSLEGLGDSEGELGINSDGLSGLEKDFGSQPVYRIASQNEESGGIGERYESTTFFNNKTDLPTVLETDEDEIQDKSHTDVHELHRHEEGKHHSSSEEEVYAEGPLAEAIPEKAKENIQSLKTQRSNAKRYSVRRESISGGHTDRNSSDNVSIAPTDTPSETTYSVDSSSDSYISIGSHESAALMRAKRSRRLKRLFTYLPAGAAVKSLRRYYTFLISTLFIVSAVLIIVLELQSVRFIRDMEEIGSLGQVTVDAIQCAFDADLAYRLYLTQSEQSYWPDKYHGGPSVPQNKSQFLPRMNAMLAELDEKGAEINDIVTNFNAYTFGSGLVDINSEMFQTVFNPRHVELINTIDTTTLEREGALTTVFQMILRFAAAARKLSSHNASLDDAVYTTERFFLLDNWRTMRISMAELQVVSEERLLVTVEQAIVVQLILLGAQLLLFVILVLILSHVFLKRLLYERRKLFLVFLKLPTAAMIAMINKASDSIKSQEASDNSSNSEDNGEGTKKATEPEGREKEKNGEDQEGKLEKTLQEEDSVKAVSFLSTTKTEKHLSIDDTTTREKTESVVSLKSQDSKVSLSGQIRARKSKEASKRPNSERVGRHKKQFRELLQRCVFPLFIWAVVQVFYTIYYEVTLYDNLPLSRNIYDASRRVVAVTELHILGNAWAATRLGGDLQSDYNLMYGGIYEEIEHSYTHDLTSSGFATVDERGGDGEGVSPENVNPEMNLTRIDSVTALFDRDSKNFNPSSMRRELSSVSKRGDEIQLLNNRLPKRSLLFKTLVISESDLATVEPGVRFRVNFSNPENMGKLRSSIRKQMQKTVALLEDTYGAMIYGSGSKIIGNETKGTGLDIPVYRDRRQFDLLYTTGTCHLPESQASSCPMPDDPNYHRLTQGLDTLVSEYLKNYKQILTEDKFNSPRILNWVYDCSENLFPHVQAGFTKSLEYFLEESQRNKDSLFYTQITILVITEVLLIVYYAIVIAPFFRTVMKEGDKSVSLLASVPRRYAVDAIVAQVAGMTYNTVKMIGANRESRKGRPQKEGVSGWSGFNPIRSLINTLSRLRGRSQNAVAPEDKSSSVR